MEAWRRKATTREAHLESITKDVDIRTQTEGETHMVSSMTREQEEEEEEEEVVEEEEEEEEVEVEEEEEEEEVEVEVEERVANVEEESSLLLIAVLVAPIIATITTIQGVVHRNQGRRVTSTLSMAATIAEEGETNESCSLLPTHATPVQFNIGAH